MKKAFIVELPDDADKKVGYGGYWLSDGTLLTETKMLNRENVEKIVKATIKDYFGYKDIIMPIYNINKGNLYKLLADKICELIKD